MGGLKTRTRWCACAGCRAACCACASRTMARSLPLLMLPLRISQVHAYKHACGHAFAAAVHHHMMTNPLRFAGRWSGRAI